VAVHGRRNGVTGFGAGRRGRAGGARTSCHTLVVDSRACGLRLCVAGRTGESSGHYPTQLAPVRLGHDLCHVRVGIAAKLCRLDRCQGIEGLVPSTDVTAVDDDPFRHHNPRRIQHQLRATQERQSSLFSIGPPYRKKSHQERRYCLNERDLRQSLFLVDLVVLGMGFKYNKRRDDSSRQGPPLPPWRWACAEGSAFSAGCLLGPSDILSAWLHSWRRAGF